MCPSDPGESDTEQGQVPAVDKLGGPGCVAEMTGRKGHIVRNAQGRGVYSLRAKPDSQEMDSLNVNEMGKRAEA